MEIPTREELVERIDAFLQRHDMAPSRLGRAATGEPNLIFSIRDGRQPNLDTLNRLARFMTEQDELLAAEQGDNPEWPVRSANNGAEIIGDASGCVATDNLIGGHAEADSPDPFPDGKPEQANAPASSPTSSPTSARPTSSSGSAASLTGEPA